MAGPDALRPLARGLDPAAYVDESAFATERERVFARSWLPVCRVEDVAAPCDYVARDLMGDPVVVVRGRDGELSALGNVCRHRNMVIAEGAGSVRALQCPYHLWTYDLGGRLVGAPLAADVAGFDRDGLCLPRLAVEEWHGFVLVHLDPDAAPFGAQVPGLDALLGAFDVAGMVRVGSHVWDQPWNWKTTLENYAESYHHRGVHGDTLQPLWEGELSRPVPGGDEPWMALEHTSAVDGLPELLVVAAYPLLWPSFVGDEAMTWLRIEPHSAARSTLTIEVFVPADKVDDTDLVASHVEAVRDVNAQDEAANRGVQAGLASRFAVPSTLLPIEDGIAHFQAWYQARMP